MRRISWAIFAVAIVQLCLVLVTFQNLASPAFLIVSAGMGIWFAFWTELQATVLSWPSLRRKTVLAFYSWFLFIIGTSCIGAIIGFAVGPPPGGLTYGAGVVQIGGIGLMIAWFREVVRRDRVIQEG